MQVSNNIASIDLATTQALTQNILQNFSFSQFYRQISYPLIFQVVYKKKTGGLSPLPSSVIKFKIQVDGMRGTLNLVKSRFQSGFGKFHNVQR